MIKTLYVDRRTMQALSNGQGFVALPCRGIYNALFSDVVPGDEYQCIFIYGSRQICCLCKLSIGTLPKEKGGYVGQEYYILTLLS